MPQDYRNVFNEVYYTIFAYIDTSRRIVFKIVLKTITSSKKALK